MAHAQISTKAYVTEDRTRDFLNTSCSVHPTDLPDPAMLDEMRFEMHHT